MRKWKFTESQIMAVLAGPRTRYELSHLDRERREVPGRGGNLAAPGAAARDPPLGPTISRDGTPLRMTRAAYQNQPTRENQGIA